MKFALTGEYTEFFKRNHAIEFERLFSDDQMKNLGSCIDQGLALKLGVKQSELEDVSPEKKFQAGHDLWRTTEHLKRIICQRQLAQFAAQLTSQRTLRLGYDQLLPSPKNMMKSEAYVQLLKQSVSLNEISSLQGVVCGLMICIGQGSQEGTQEKEQKVFAEQPGNAVFLLPEKLIDFPQLMQREDKNYLLIVYTVQNAVYIKNPKDPHGTVLRQMGYSYGDKLLDKRHPIVYRE